MIIYRVAKGAPLTGEDLDQNFKDLELRLEALESHKTPGVRPFLSLEGDMLFQGHGPEKHALGRLPLPRLNPRGQWQSNCDYFPLDLVLVEDQIFCCSKTHTSSEIFSMHRDAWEIFFKLPTLKAQGDL